MDAHRFDAITKALATPRPRRAVLRALLGAAGAAALGARGAAAASGELCRTHLECPGKQLCQFDDATQTRRCTTLEGLDPSEGRICKGEFEHTYCQRGSICCVSPGIRDTGGGPVLELVANCCDDGLVCDREAGCVLPPGAR